MGITTDHEHVTGGYAEAANQAGPAASRGRTVLRRRSALPSKRAVLHAVSLPDLWVADDLVRWYTERGFHFYVADLRPPRGQAGQHAGKHGLREQFALLDAACEQLRERECVSSVIVSAQKSDAPTVALWCDARPAMRPADALILYQPEFGRELRRGLHIPCPVLVLCQAATAAYGTGKRAGGNRRAAGAAAALGQHVTWRWLGSSPAPETSRRLLFDEIGRWLGAYMYGRARDQLL